MRASLLLSRSVAILAITQVLSWGSLYYAFAIVAPDLQRQFAWRAEWVYGAFSWCLLVAGLAATPVGMLLDRLGGRPVMACGSLLCSAGFVLLALANSLATYYLAWTVLGLAMSMVLYEAAFATLNHEFGLRARQAISTLTLAGGFASSVFWPLTLAIEHAIGWRDTYLLYAGVQVLVCLPLHLLLRAGAPHTQPQAKDVPHFTLAQAMRTRAFWLLALAFAANSFIFSSLGVHLIPILQKLGHAASTVVLMAALIGPLQVAGRVGEMAFARHTTPELVGKITFVALPGALLTLLLGGTYVGAVAAFCVFYGLSNGILTIVRGTIPQALFGAKNYGAISGAMSGPSLIARAAGPIGVAALSEAADGVHTMFAVLFAVSILSLLFYLLAIRSRVLLHEN